MLQLSTSIN